MEHHVLDAMEWSGTGEGCDDKKRGGGREKEAGACMEQERLKLLFLAD
jgi:hypothetical protein